MEGSDFLICPSCNQGTEEGKFCTKCGASLEVETNAASDTEANATETATGTQQEASTTETSSAGSANEVSEKFKEAATGFGHFAVQHLKSPGKARELTEKSWISGALTIVITALLFSILIYVTLNSSSFFSPDFMDDFFLPFLKYLLFLILSVAVIFGTGKFIGSKATFLDVLAKTGGYLFPFTVLFLAGYLLVYIGLDFMAYAMLIAIFAPIFFIPTFILMDTTPRSTDKIYVLMAIYIVHLVLGYYLILETLLGTIFNSVASFF